ncbi:MAG: hypothetical protein JRJ00_00280 [Deltaproteobacteria bacterium]|nr:hypothetical protein [Deltaproteobacteria bacterium]
MKIFADNQVDEATVSSDDSTINYPPSNVQVSRLSRIYKGEESIDFDITGSGALKNISQAYTNLIQDPTDLTTGNWTLTNDATAVSSSEEYMGNAMTQIGSTTATADPQITQSVSTTIGNLLEYVIVLRNGNHTNSAGDKTQLLITTTATIFDVAITWVDKTVVASTGTVNYSWKDDNTVEIKGVSIAATTGTALYRIDPITTADTDKYIYATYCQIVDDCDCFFPFISGSKTADVIEETFTMPDRFTFDVIITPNFKYDTSATSPRFLSWAVPNSSFTNSLLIYYSITNDDLRVLWHDSGTAQYLESQTFDDGTSLTNINQRIRLIGSMDLISGLQTASRFICIPLETGSINEDTTWSGVPSIKTTTFPTMQIGHKNSTQQADSSFEYLRIYAGLLIGDVTSSDDATELLKDKKILFDATYQQKLTATDILIANSTINDGDVITLRAGDTDSFGEGTPLDETIDWSKLITKHTFTKSTYQYWRLSVNSSNDIEMGRIYLGESYVPPGISPTVTHDKVSASQKSISISGQSYLDRRYLYEIISTTFPSVTHEQKDELSELLELVDIGDPFFVEFDEECSDLGTMYVTLNQESFRATLLSNPNYYTVSFSLRQEV